MVSEEVEVVVATEEVVVSEEGLPLTGMVDPQEGTVEAAQVIDLGEEIKEEEVMASEAGLMVMEAEEEEVVVLEDLMTIQDSVQGPLLEVADQDVKFRYYNKNLQIVFLDLIRLYAHTSYKYI